jgi:hypothetical protein
VGPIIYGHRFFRSDRREAVCDITPFEQSTSHTPYCRIHSETVDLPWSIRHEFGGLLRDDVRWSSVIQDARRASREPWTSLSRGRPNTKPPEKRRFQEYRGSVCCARIRVDGQRPSVRPTIHDRTLNTARLLQMVIPHAVLRRALPSTRAAPEAMTPRAPSQEIWLRRSAAFGDHWGRCRRVVPVRAARRPTRTERR